MIGTSTDRTRHRIRDHPLDVGPHVHVGRRRERLAARRPDLLGRPLAAVPLQLGDVAVRALPRDDERDAPAGRSASSLLHEHRPVKTGFDLARDPNPLLEWGGRVATDLSPRLHRPCRREPELI